MAAIDDIQFDMAATLVAVMVVLFDLVYQDLREPSTPSPGAFRVDLLYLEEPIRAAEHTSFGSPYFLEIGGEPTISLPWPKYTADGRYDGASRASQLSCMIHGDPATGVQLVYEDVVSPSDRTTGGGEPLQIAASLARFGARLPPYESNFPDTDLAFTGLLERLGFDESLATDLDPKVWPKYSSNRNFGGHHYIVASHDPLYRDGRDRDYFLVDSTDDNLGFRETWNAPTVRSADRNSPPSSWHHFDITSEVADRLLEVKDGSGPGWLADPNDVWLVAAFLPFRPYVHFSCEGSGTAVRFGTEVQIEVAPTGCSASNACGANIRPMHLLALRATASFRSEPLHWHLGSGVQPPVSFTAPVDTISGQAPRVSMSTTLTVSLDK